MSYQGKGLSYHSNFKYTLAIHVILMLRFLQIKTILFPNRQASENFPLRYYTYKIYIFTKQIEFFP